MPCHKKLVNDAAGHGHHQAGSKGNECVACHMPMTRFAAMGRTDHSMRPPTPATTLAFKSPNACNLCHADRDASWADGWVRKWYAGDYQAEVLRRASLLDQARKRHWKRLPEILAEIQKQGAEEIYRTSLVRLLGGCEDQRKWPVLLGSLQDPSPLVRSSAVSALGSHLTPEVLQALLAAAADPSRLVRIRSAMALAALDPASLSSQRDRTNLQKAIADFMAAMHARPDDWSAISTWRATTSPRPPPASRPRRSWSRDRSARGSTRRWPTATWSKTTRPKPACAARWRWPPRTRRPTSISDCSWAS
jgi:hypothetical protein